MQKTIYLVEYRTLLRLLRTARQEAGITQEQIARKLSATQSSIGKIERGERRIDIIELRAFCSALGIDFLSFIEAFEREIRDQTGLGNT